MVCFSFLRLNNILHHTCVESLLLSNWKSELSTQITEEIKPKLTRSRARHLRRRRLIIARKAAENNLNNKIINNTNIDKQTLFENNLNSREIETFPTYQSSINEGLSKSKARRLRRKNKKNACENSILNNQQSNNEQNCHLNEQLIRENNVEINSCSTDSCLLIKEYQKSEKNTFKQQQNQALIENTTNLQINLNSEQKNCSNFSSNICNNDSIITHVDDRKIINHESLCNKSNNLIIEGGMLLKGALLDTENKNTPDNNNESTVKNSINSDKLNISDHDINLKNNLYNSDTMEESMNNESKSREQVKAEREAKKAAKAAAKIKNKIEKTSNTTLDTSFNLSQAQQTVSNTSNLTKKINNTPSVELLSQEMTHLSLNSQEEKSSSTNKNDGKNKSELRAERRAKQEAQRTAKELEKENKKSESVAKSTGVVTVSPKPSNKRDKIDSESKKLIGKPTNQIMKDNNHEINLFKHLYHERAQALIHLPINANIHSAIVKLGVQYASKIIVGSNARCIALLSSLKQLINDYERPSQADFTRGLESSLQESMAYLHHCRPLAVSMMNALKHIKWRMSQLPTTISDEEAKNKLENTIDTYIKEQILLAGEAISMKIRTKIYNNDVILTYGYSSLIQKVLCDAYDAGRKFHVIVVDSRPWFEGRELIRRLAKHGVSCSYVLINALSFIMPKVSKVFLGAHAILANGAVMSRAGTAQVALMAKAFNVPVLVACETHKSCERAQTDSIVYNEIGDAEELIDTIKNGKKNVLANWRSKKSLNLLNIVYDVTPADLVTAVVTELAILPCTSVPVILRIKPSEIQ